MANLNEQLFAGIDQICNAFKTQKLNFDSELEITKAERDGANERVRQLEGENEAYKRKTAELEQFITKLKAENAAISDSFNQLSVNFTNLKRVASQLESFRNNMINIVQSTPVSQSLDQWDIDTSQMDESLNSKTFLHGLGSQLSQSPSKSLGLNSPFDYSNEFSRSMSISMPSSTQKKISPIDEVKPYLSSEQFNALSQDESSVNASDSILVTENFNIFNGFVPPNTPSGGNVKEQNSNLPIIQKKNGNALQVDLAASTDTLRNSSSSQQIKSNPELVNPATLYRMIRKQITPKEFDSFSKNIANFNNGVKSAQETVDAIKEINMDQNLIIQMEMLIYNASVHQ